MKTLAWLRFLAGMVLILSCPVVANCSSPTPRVSQQDAVAAEMPEWCRPQLLYLLPSPNSRLYVEVDAVEGCVPDEAELQKLRIFLRTYCNKPDGIEIVRSEVIPVAIAKGISPGALARKYIHGPGTNNAASTAFMCVLFYNDALCEGSSVGRIENPGPGKAPARRPKIANPYAEILPYPAIYFNTRYASGMGKNEMLLHEAGHLLGLVRRPTGELLHCPDRACLMNADLRLHRLLVGQQRQLCPLCAAELAQDSKQPPPPNLRFVGPVLVRSEAGYHVLSLPKCSSLVVGNLTDQDCRDFAAAQRAEALSSGDNDESVGAMVKDEALGDPAKLVEIINRAAADPYQPLGAALAPLCAEHGLFTNAVNIYRRAIAANPENDEAFNQLAWIKATCPDASIRDGKEAVADATKACELSDWKNGAEIDTLAAAHAEAGDFNRAIEYQERALRAGNPTESEQKAMRERLSLYKQSKPFRDK